MSITALRSDLTNTISQRLTVAEGISITTSNTLIYTAPDYVRYVEFRLMVVSTSTSQGILGALRVGKSNSSGNAPTSGQVNAGSSSGWGGAADNHGGTTFTVFPGQSVWFRVRALSGWQSTGLAFYNALEVL